MKLRSLTLEVTNRCLNDCLYCSSRSTPQSSEQLNQVDISNFLFDATQDMGLETVCISGGEPLLHPELEKILSYAKGFNLRVCLFTTGIVDVAGKPQPFVDWPKLRHCVDTVVFDIQSDKEAIHDKLSGQKGSFRRTVLSLSAAVEAGFQIGCNVIPNEINLDSLTGLARFANHVGISQLNILRFVPQGRGEDNFHKLRLDGIAANHLVWLLFFIINDRDLTNLTVRLGAPFSFTGLTESRCSLCKDKLLVRSDGYGYPCEAMKTQDDLKLGHISEVKPQVMLKAARQNEKLRALRRGEQGSYE